MLLRGARGLAGARRGVSGGRGWGMYWGDREDPSGDGGDLGVGGEGVLGMRCEGVGGG